MNSAALWAIVLGYAAAVASLGWWGLAAVAGHIALLAVPVVALWWWRRLQSSP